MHFVTTVTRTLSHWLYFQWPNLAVDSAVYVKKYAAFAINIIVLSRFINLTLRDNARILRIFFAVN